MRQVITAKDIQIYFGKKPSMSFKMMSQMKKDLRKLKHQPITIVEFCQYYNVEKEGIEKCIKEVETSKQKVDRELVHIKTKVDVLQSIKQPVAMIKQSDTYTFSKKTW
jgi:isochorismate hydrolase